MVNRLKVNNLQPSTFNLQPSTFNVQPSTFNLQPPTFNLQPPTSNLQPSTFNLQSNRITMVAVSQRRRYAHCYRICLGNSLADSNCSCRNSVCQLPRSQQSLSGIASYRSGFWLERSRNWFKW